MHDTDLQGFLILKALLSSGDSKTCSCVKLRFSRRPHTAVLFIIQYSWSAAAEIFFSVVEKVDCAPINLQRIRSVPRQK